MDRRQILVVDDYAGARYLRSRILTDAGYEVVEAENGEDALRLAATPRCDTNALEFAFLTNNASALVSPR